MGGRQWSTLLGVASWAGSQRLTSMHPLQRVEEAHQQVHEDGQVEGNVAPHRDVSGAPVQHRLG